MENKKKIFWLTGANFYDVDLPVIPEIAKSNCIIDWHIFFGFKKLFSEDEILSSTFPTNENLNVFIHKTKVHAISPKRILEYYHVFVKQIKREKYDVVYINMFDLGYLFPLLYVCRVKNVVYACHDVVPHLGFPNRKLYICLQKFIFSRFQNFHIFSEKQFHIFTGKYPKKNVLMAELTLKDFGKSKLQPPKDKMVFTYFGGINKGKGIDYLIKAGNHLYSKFKNQFVINIFGFADNWEQYERRIKENDAFNLEIRYFKNNEIPDICSSSHFVVLPYKDVTQSGVLCAAYNYHIPLICSDLEGFRTYVINGQTGYLFQPENWEALSKTMEYVIEHKGIYDEIKQNLIYFVEEKYSTVSIAKKYVNFFATFSHTNNL